MSEEEELFSVEEVITGETQIVTVEEVRTTSEPQVVTTTSETKVVTTQESIQEKKVNAELNEVHTSVHISERPSEKKSLEVEETVHKSHEDEISPELEELLHTDPVKGLNQQEIAERLAKFGRNELAEVKRNALLHFLSFCTYQTEFTCYLFTGAIAYLIEIAWILSAVTQDWINFGIIGGLLLINALIGYVEEAKAESALDALKQTLALKTRCWRDGQLIEVEAAELVPGDVIVLRLGDIIPADARLLGIGVTGEATEGDLQVDQSALTGESLPVSRRKGHTVYSSSVVKQGQQLAVVTKTGVNTFIGRAANLISITVDEGHFQKIVNQIGNFLIYITVVLVVIIFIDSIVKAKLTYGTVTGDDVLQSLKEVLVLTVAA
ncbi:E1-E2 ATPase-domain-containing protein [Endogone sp. FLAS-F59071]|nr:E1-E2 ATPase-domain-containing protein [Endogone sp. FLAS-F59071]|eukprot:RUS19775.1 E1-E2 ATPase-domain-containing protein [Endogone sp. FLAS-F59071]